MTMLKRAKATFEISSIERRDTGLALGPGITVSILDVSAKEVAKRPGFRGRLMRATAKLELETHFTLGNDEFPEPFVHCAGCKVVAPDPDADGLWYIFENCGNNGRLAWAREENAARERDAYPVAGWQRIENDLFCPACAAKIRAVISAVKGGVQ